MDHNRVCLGKGMDKFTNVLPLRDINMDTSSSISTSTLRSAMMVGNEMAASTLSSSSSSSSSKRSLAEMNRDGDERILADGSNDRAATSTACRNAMPQEQEAPSSVHEMQLERRSSTRNRLRHTLSPMLLLLQLAALAGSISIANAQSTNDEVCSCSPKQFVFRLDLSASCPPLPPPFPPNDVFGAGVKDYTCTIGPEPIPTGSVTSEDSAVVIDEREVDNDGARSLQGGVGRAYKTTAFDTFPELTQAEFMEFEEIDIEELEWSSENFSTSQTTDVGDVIPVTIYSIQFLEVDQQFNVINQDSSYVRGIEFTNGDVFNYTSIQGQIPGVVPGGMNMVLRGVNADNEPIRNVFTITYTNDCGVQTFEEGDAIGWVVFENFEPASDLSCDGVTESPTPSPTSKPNTPAPTPTLPTTPRPTPSPTPEPTTPSPTVKPTTKSPSSTPSPTGKPTSPIPTANPTTKSPSSIITPSPTMKPISSSMSMEVHPPSSGVFGKSAKLSKTYGHSSKSSKSSKSTKSSKSGSKSSKHGKSIEDGVSPYPGRRQREMMAGHYNGPLRAADTAFFTDTVLDEFQLDVDNTKNGRGQKRRLRQQRR